MLSPAFAPAAFAATRNQRTAFGQFSTSHIEQPVAFAPVLEHIAARPEATTLKHSLFADGNGFYETEERMPQITKRVAFEYYLNARVRSDEVVFTYGSDTPIAKFTLPEGRARVIWETTSDTGTRRELMMVAASGLLDRMVNDLGDKRITVEEDGKAVTRKITRADIGYRVGSADTIAAAIERVRPYATYFTQRSEAAGLDGLIWANTIQETDFSIDRISHLGYEGPFQLGYEEAKRQGLVAEKPVKSVRTEKFKVKGKTKTRKIVSFKEPARPHINEVFHPLLPVDASAPTVREYSFIMGSLTDGLGAYHHGPGNGWKSRALYTSEVEQADSDIAQVIATEYGFTPEILCDPNDDFEAPLSLVQRSWMIRVGWRLPHNDTGFKIESAKYVPRTLSIMQLLRERLTQYDSRIFEADQVTIDYRGKRSLKAKELRPFFKSNEEFKRYNSHFRHFNLYPEKGIDIGDITIPAGTRVLLPLGQSEEFFEKFEDRIERTSPVVYWDGVVSPLPRRVATPADAAYTRIAVLRHAGQYHLVDGVAIKAVHNAVIAEAKIAPSKHLDALRKTVEMDLQFYDARIYAPFLDSSASVAGR
jgi:hypothetical protein